MYVCLCRGVSDRKIRAAIAAGASTLAEIGKRTMAGIECGTCHPGIEELLRESRDPNNPARLAAGRPKMAMKENEHEG